ncbi:unnamed protein product (macronuclear) [Paramecium tetraurelia]|uniref:Uncharacterized protein n=1 Tax=Paramecium tetraurelia TaxID=5888 RepID=A0C8N2_PARTE|nr:uncharacterized protein GSPATT00036284001 [Paramecium tetraurelia]CAK67149.1 unnamed protein product [Paramecium tetraurelia]|eukprot:XP_001434546.1 hypothetical protein (macronuclear) [Paramecium tetraurelia strain d4-2]
MDSLIEKWKKTTQSASRYSEQKLKKPERNHSSSSESSQEQKRVNNVNKNSPQPQTTKSLKQSNQSSGKKQTQQSLPNSGNKKFLKPQTFSQLLDFYTSQFQTLFKSNILPSQLNEQIKTILVDYAENIQSLSASGYTGAQVEELQNKLNQAEQQIYTLKNSNAKDDFSKKIINELEDKLLESEKQRVKLKQQKEQMQIQIEKISESLAKYQINQDLIHQMKQENLQLRKNNDILVTQIQQLNTQNKEQQVLWNQQIEDLIKMMDILRKSTNS